MVLGFRAQLLYRERLLWAEYGFEGRELLRGLDCRRVNEMGDVVMGHLALIFMTCHGEEKLVTLSL